jgi:5-methylcytosine-specific restriction protein A
MTRAVDEWVGATDDTRPPKRVQLRLLLKYEGRCYRTGHKFRPGDKIEFDHIKALCNGGLNVESNLAPILGGKPHQEKTREDLAERVKTDRLRAKNLGLWPKSRGFNTRLKRKMDGSVVER